MIRNIVFTWIVIGFIIGFVFLRADYTATLAYQHEEIEVLKEALMQEQLKNVPEESESEAYKFMKPIYEDDFIKYTSPFGIRNVPAGIYTGGSTTRDHNGLDMIGLWHARVVAVDAGRVIQKWYVPDGKRRKGHPIYGGYIVIQHANGFETHYAHLSWINNVHEGDYVRAGQVIGRQSETGLADGEHLHFMVKLNGVFVNPLKYIEGAY